MCQRQLAASTALSMQGRPCAHSVQLDALDAIAVLLLEDTVVGFIVSTHMRPHYVLQLIPVATSKCSLGTFSWVTEYLTALRVLQ